MDVAFQVLGYLFAIPLGVLTIRALLRGEYRHYPILLLYLVVDLLTSVLEILTRVLPLAKTRAARHTFVLIYWIDEEVIQFLLFLLVVSLVYRSSAHLRTRRALVFLLVCFSLLYAGGSLLWHYDPHLTWSKWLTPWARDMNFAAAILDLGLWALLISRPKRDWRLLMVSGALGIQFTGGAIGQSLRDLSHEAVLLSALLIVASNVACLYIWWQVFRKPPQKEKGRSAASSQVSPC